MSKTIGTPTSGKTIDLKQTRTSFADKSIVYLPAYDDNAAPGSKDAKIPLSSFGTMFFTATAKADLTSLQAGVGDVARVANSGLSYRLTSSPATTIGNWKLISHLALMTEAEFTAISTNTSDIEQGQIVDTTDGKRRRVYDSVNGWMDVGSFGGSRIEEILTWSVDNVTPIATITLSYVPSDIRSVVMYLRNQSIMRLTADNAPSSVWNAATKTITIDPGDFGVNNGDEVLVAYTV